MIKQPFALPVKRGSGKHRTSEQHLALDHAGKLARNFFPGLAHSERERLALKQLLSLVICRCATSPDCAALVEYYRQLVLDLGINDFEEAE